MATQKKYELDNTSEPDINLLKHSAVIHMQCTLTAKERLLYNHLLFNARPNMRRGSVHEIALKDLSARGLPRLGCCRSTKESEQPHPASSGQPGSFPESA